MLVDTQKLVDSWEKIWILRVKCGRENDSRINDDREKDSAVQSIHSLVEIHNKQYLYYLILEY